MMHENRRWSVRQVDSIEELADLLLNHSWCLCQGFELEGQLWLNDATGPDAAQEYAVVSTPRPGADYYRQVESITVSWCNRAQLVAYIAQCQAGQVIARDQPGVVAVARSTAEIFHYLGISDSGEWGRLSPHVEPASEHAPCVHCR